MIFQNQQLKQFLEKLALKAFSKNELLLAVGGAVRDQILQSQIEIRDIDLIYSANAIEFIEEIQNELGITIRESYKPFFTIKISIPGLEDYEIELASAREEKYLSPASFPQVKLATAKTAIERIEQDLKRRDFTINALLSALDKNSADFCNTNLSKRTIKGLEIYDLCNAFQDLDQKLIRVFHSNSFIDDPTRVVRAERFALKTGFQIEAKTLALIKTIRSSTEWANYYQKRKNRFHIEEELLANTNPAT